MALPSRHEALATLDDGQQQLDALFDRLSNDELTTPATIGDWAAKDLMGHIAFWEELALRTLDASRAGVSAWPEGATADSLNAQNQAQWSHRSATELRARAASAHEALLAALSTITDEEWHQGVGESLGGVLGAPGQPFAHAYAHLDDLRRYVESVG
jgi:hypothetical protein